MLRERVRLLAKRGGTAELALRPLIGRSAFYFAGIANLVFFRKIPSAGGVMGYELPKTYDFKSAESRIYAMWEAGGYFKPWNDPNKPGFNPNIRPFVISIPRRM
jgi:hypothetical protein